MACAGIAWGVRIGFARRAKVDPPFCAKGPVASPAGEGTKHIGKLFCARMRKARLCTAWDWPNSVCISRRALLHAWGWCQIRVIRAFAQRSATPHPQAQAVHRANYPGPPLDDTSPNLFKYLNISCWLPESAREEKTKSHAVTSCCLTDAKIESVGPNGHHPTIEKIRSK